MFEKLASMYDVEGCPNGYIACKCLNPCNFDVPERLLVSLEYLSRIKKYSNAAKFWECFSVPIVACEPKAIFEGLEREGEDDSYCYCGIPTERYLDKGQSVPWDKRFVLLVFVRWDERGLIAFDWERRRADPDERGFPLNWRQDFRRLKWPD